MKKVIKGLSVILMAALLMQVVAPGVFAVGDTGERVVPILDDGNGIVCDEYDFSEPPEYNNAEDAELSPIIGEDSSLRDANTKHFRLENGTYIAASYAAPVHFEENGEWRDIDNTLTLSSASGRTAYTQKASAFPVSIPQSMADGQKITLANKGYTIGFGVSADNRGVSLQSEARLTGVEALASSALLADGVSVEEPAADESLTDAEKIRKQNDEKMKVENQESAVVYENVFPGADLEYIVSGTGIKENIVQNSPQDGYIYNFDIDLAGLIPVSQEDGSIWLVEEGNPGDPVFFLPAPYMYDANGEESFDVAMRIEGGTLIVEASTEWINNEERMFPIVIDPNIMLNTSSAILDTYVNSSLTGTNYFTSPNLYAGRGNSLFTTFTRSYIKFNLPALPADKVVTYAEFKLKEWDSFSAVPVLIYDASKISWTPSALKFNNQPSPITTAANSCKNKADLPLLTSVDGLVPGDDHWYCINITEEVERWYNEGGNGLIITSVDETAGGLQAAMHSANTTLSNEKPIFTINYVNSKELDDLYTRETVSLGRSGAVTVNQFNGMMTYAHNDLSMNGNRMPISISHVYKPTTANDGGKQANMYFGNGYNLNIVEKIRELESTEAMYDEGYRYEYITSSGASYYFLLSAAANKFVYEYSVIDPANSTQVGYSSWFITKSGSTLTMEDNQGNKKVFLNVLVSEPQISRLIKIEDANGNEQNINYSSGKITSVTDGAGRIAAFTYNGSNHLTKISDPSGREINYSYSSNNLSQITYPDGKSTLINYAANGSSITDITAFDGSYLSATTAASKVSKLERYGKPDDITGAKEKVNELTFAYNAGYTKVKDIFDNENTYYFDILGRTVSIKDRDGKVSTEKYNTADGISPKLLHNTVNYSVSQQAIINNMVKNHSFEATGDWTGYIGSGATGSSAYVTGSAYMGSRYRSITNSNGINRYSSGQAVDVIVGDVYTLSAYVKLPYSFMNSGGGAYIGFSYQTTSGSWVTDRGDYITSSPDWTRYSHTFEIPANCNGTVRIYLSVENVAGTAYFDAVQLEKADVANRYNLLENPNFDYVDGSAYPTGWTRSNMAAGDKVANNRMTVAGSLASPKYLHQTVNVSAKAGDTVFFTATSESAAANSQLEEYGRFWGIILVLTYSDGKTQNVSVPFIRNVNCPQAASAAFELPKACTKIQYCLTYYRQTTGTVYFDAAALYIGGSGSINTYNAAAGGRIEKVSSGTGLSVEYAYTGTDITKVTEKYETQTVNATTFTYDAGHNLTSATTLDGIKTEYFYTPQAGTASTFGMVTSTKVTGKDGVTKTESSVTYTNDYNYVLSKTNALGETVTYNIDEDKGLLLSATDPKGNVRSYDYDPLTDIRLSSNGASDPLTPVSTEFEYEDDAIKSIMRNDTTYTCNYNDFNQVTSVQVGTQALAANSYNSKINNNSNNNLNRVDYANGDWYEPVYDSLDRLAGQVYNGVEKYRYTYNANSQIGRITDLENGIAWTPSYDFAGRMEELAGSDGTSFKVHYDGKGFADSLILAKNGSIQSAATYTYDAVNNLLDEVRLVSMDNGTVGFAYDGMNRVTGTSHTMKSTSSNVKFNTGFSYNQYGSNETSQVGQISYEKSNNGSITPYGSLSYTYDANSNIATISENGVLKVAYSYDGLDQLLREDNVWLNATIVYNYDVGGNILRKDEYAYTIGALGVVRNSVSYVYNDANWKDKLTSFDGKAITYDQIGNPLTYDGFTYTWQKGRQLASITGNSLNMSFSYNQDGLRTKKTVNGVTTNFTWFGDTLMSQTDGVNTLIFSDFGVNINNDNYYYIKNLQGDVIGLYDSDGNIVVNYVYDSWGKIVDITGALAATIGVINPIRYRGYYYDTETGLYYLQSRYYNLEWGRFLNADALFIAGDSLTGANMFAYCGNNPVMYSDPTGEYANAWSEAWAKAIKAMLEAILAYINGSIAFAKKAESYNYKTMAIDTDGGAKVSGEQWHSDQTSYSGYGKYLDAYKVNYIVIPSDYKGKAKLGDFGVIIDNKTKKVVFAVVGDVGPKGKYNEVSVAAARNLGYSNASWNNGPEGDFTTIIFPGTKQLFSRDLWENPTRMQQKINEIVGPLYDKYILGMTYKDMW